MRVQLMRLGVVTLGALGVLLLGWHLHWSPPLTFGQSEGCRRVLINRLGTAKADVAVSNTAVDVVLRNDSRCNLLLYNSGAGAVRCMDTQDGTPTATTGLYIGPSSGRTFEREGTNAWRCIRATAADSTLNTAEGLP